MLTEWIENMFLGVKIAPYCLYFPPCRQCGQRREVMPWGPPAPPSGMVTGMIYSRDHPRVPGRIVQWDHH